MGLDMYLSKKFYVWRDKREKLEISGIKELEGQEVKELVMDAGYWRKANAIHGWFVEHVQDGEDDCKEYMVSKEDMQLLLDTVNKVLDASVLVKGKVYNGTSYSNGKETINWEDGKVIKDPKVANELLPVTEGFFFGNYDKATAYDQYYHQDLVDTKKILEKAIAEADKGFEFYYSASW
jgi:hypothetical protein